MAEGKYYDESGDFDEARDFDSLDRYREEDQAYLRAHSQTHLNGKPLEEDDKNTAGFGKFGRRQDEDGNSRWGLLRKGEKDASEKPNRNGKGGDKKASLGEKENNVKSDDNSMGGKFKNAVKGVKDLKSGKVGKAKGRFKKAGPLAAIIALCCGFGATSFFGQMAMPFSLMSVLQGNFDSISVSNLSRTNRMLRWQMKPSTRKTSTNADEFVKKHSKIYQKFTGKSEKYFDLSRKQVRKLAKAGIEVKTDSSTGEKVMNFKRANGEVSVITADDFKAKLDTDPDFNTAFQEGTKTWRKSVASWFDGKAKSFLEKIKVARNRFKDYRKGDDSAKNKQSYEETVKAATGDGDVDGKTGDKKIEQTEEKTVNPETNEETTVVKTDITDNGENQLELKRGAKAKQVETSLRKFSDGVGTKVTKAASSIVKGGCVVSEIVSAINMLVIASEAIQILQVASSVFEGIQKAQVGDSSGTPINEIGNSLTQNKTTTYKDKNNKEQKKEGSAMSSAGISALFGNTATDTSDASVNSFNLTDSINSIMDAVGGTIKSYKNCLIAKIGAGLLEAGLEAAELAADVAATAACIAGAVETFGLSCLPALGKMIAKKVAGLAAGLALSQIIGHVVKFMVPKVATMMMRDLATNIGGEDFGNAIASGANMLMGQNHQFGGGSLATKATLVTYLNKQQEYIAEQARYERQTRSPFDISSQYTFLGSLFARSVPLLTQTSSITSGIMNFGNTTLSAFSSIMPHASAMTSAVTAQKAAESTAERCPELDGVGAVGDAFCNPYFITDFSTMDDDPAEIVYRVSKYTKDGNKNFDDSNDNEDVPTINEKEKESRLYDYIIYCGQRSATTFGMADQNVANSINEGAGAVESSIPVWGGLSDMFQSTDIIEHFGYVSGQACVTGNSGDGLGSKVFSWKEARDYQRFIEDQRLAENMGLVEKSSVTVALEHYYEKNPIDDSFEGILAYYSGMSKEKVSDTLDLVEGFTWIAGYDPSDLYPIKDTSFKVADRGEAVVENEYRYDYIIPNGEYIVYRREYTIG